MNIMDMKDVILNNISMIQILDKYSIQYKRQMFNCPFHGQDKHPSAKAYNNSYHCFCCGSTGDTIRFVQNYFGLSFKEAMCKINYDFNLGLSINEPLDVDKLKKIQDEKFKKKKYKERLVNKYCYLCDLMNYYRRIIEHLESHTTIKNWETTTLAVSTMRDRLYSIEQTLTDIDNKLCSRI